MIKGKKVFIVGLARSGYAVSNLIYKDVSSLTIVEENENDENIEKLKELGIDIIICPRDKQADYLNDTYDYVIKNPGVPFTAPTIVKAEHLNIPIINELEVAFDYLPKEISIIGITGSNGKTTVTTLIYEILKKSNKSVFLGGNIGIPLSEIALQLKPHDILVLEISDHQLANMQNFKTDISVLTNISETHLDFWGSYDLYKNAKKKIFAHHTNHNLAIINKNNKESLELTSDIPSKKKYFSINEKAETYIKDKSIFYLEEEVIKLDDIKIKGNHNYENIMAAILIVKHYNVNNEIIKEFLKEFKGIEHRIEYVTTFNKRIFYNDSKSTNNKSTITALSSFDQDIILILGGLNRGQDFKELKPYMQKVRKVICYGENKNYIAKDMSDLNIECLVVENLKKATVLAYEKSKEDNIILFSPASASWDQFKNFEERGLVFKETIKELK